MTVRSFIPTLLLAVVCFSPLLGESNVDIKRDGKKFTLHAYADIDKSASYVWPYIWEFKHLEKFVDNAEVDSIAGGSNWYDVKFTGEFPFVHTEIQNHKWVITEGKSIGSKMTSACIESALPLEIIESVSYWRIEPLSEGKCRVHYKSEVKVDMAGMEGLYTGIAKRDGKRILKNFKSYVENN
jgi:hypothetical protein